MPAQLIELLGLIIDSANLTLSLKPKKVQGI